jgi:hypothetical protein
MFADFDEHVGYAIEELQRTIDLLAVARLLADDDALPDLAITDRRRYMALLTQQAVWANDCALDLFQRWPEHLEK